MLQYKLIPKKIQQKGYDRFCLWHSVAFIKQSLHCSKDFALRKQVAETRKKKQKKTTNISQQNLCKTHLLYCIHQLQFHNQGAISATMFLNYNIKRKKYLQ